MQPHRLTVAIVLFTFGGCTSDSAVTPTAPTAEQTTDLNPADSPADFSTPETTFETAKAAIQRDDYQAFCDCWTPDGMKWMVGGLGFAGAMVRGISEKRALEESSEGALAKQRIAAINNVFENHGLSDNVQLGISLQMTDDNQEQIRQQLREHFSKIAAVIPNKVQFVTDFFQTLAQLSDDPSQKVLPEASVLTELLIENDTATAVIQKRKGERVRKSPVIFARINGEWKFVEISGLTQ